LALFALASVLVVVFAIVGLAAGMRPFATNFVRGACFVDSVSIRIGGFADQLVAPIDTLNEKFAISVEAVKDKLGDTGPINDALDKMALRFSNLKDASEGADDCPEIQRVHVASSAAEDATVEKGKDLEKDLASVQASINSNMLSGQAAIQAATAGAKSSADAFKSNLDSILDATAKMGINAAKQVNAHQDKISAGPFAWCFVVVVFAGVGMALMKLNTFSRPTSKADVAKNPALAGTAYVTRVSGMGACGSRLIACGWASTFFFAAVSSVFGGTFMAISAMFVDACPVLDGFPLKMASINSESAQTGNLDGSAASNASNVDIISGCWRDESIFDLLGLDKSLTFNDIDFGPSDNLGKITLVNPEYERLEDEVNAIPDSAKCVQREQVQNAWVRVSRSRETAEDEIRVYQNMIQSIKMDQVAILSNSSEAIRKAGRCGFIKSTWDDLHEILCARSGAVHSLGIVSTMCMLLGITGFFSAVLLFVSAQRNGGHGPTAATTAAPGATAPESGPPTVVAVVPMPAPVEVQATIADRPYATTRPGDNAINSSVAQYSI
jgi:hypothetical protein